MLADSSKVVQIGPYQRYGVQTLLVIRGTHDCKDKRWHKKSGVRFSGELDFHCCWIRRSDFHIPLVATELLHLFCLAII